MKIATAVVTELNGGGGRVGLAGFVARLRIGVAFEELPALEAGSGADQGDQVGCVHGAPTVLGSLDQRERRRDPPGGLGPGAPW